MYDSKRERFRPVEPDASGIVTWIHIGDLHMVRAGEQNYTDLVAIVREVNEFFAGQQVGFVYLPGDIADNGDREAYAAVRSCLDELEIPWCAVVGDHDVHERSFANYQEAMGEDLFGCFDVGSVRFLRLNCFSEPRPDSFSVCAEQLQWLERKLADAEDVRPVILMHCYPSDLKQGGKELTWMLRDYRVRVVDMGHTHYNEISNDGETLYTATRSTGQVEEGPVGYSVLSLDGEVLSWHFCNLGSKALVSITSPADERLCPDDRAPERGAPVDVRVRVWSGKVVETVRLTVGANEVTMEKQLPGLWVAHLEREAVSVTRELIATAYGSNGVLGRDAIRLSTAAQPIQRHLRDQDNALGSWPERYIFGTQLGPNKNGRKW